VECRVVARFLFLATNFHFSISVIIQKTPAEIQKMRRAGLIVWEAHQQAREYMRPGVTTEEIDRVVDNYFSDAGASALFKGVPGPVPYPAATCISLNDEVVHAIPNQRCLKEGDIVSIDTGCKIDGWCGDAAVTWPVGKISAQAKKLLDVTRDTLHLAIELMGTKKRWSEVAEVMQKHVEKHHLAVVEDLVGHGIGRSMHEAPSVPNHLDRLFFKKQDFKLEPGLVIAVEPMVNIGTKAFYTLDDGWTIATIDGKLSAHFEHTIAITENGPEVLTGGPNGESW